ncbi:hypothetical protein [Planktomarina sp.]|uniref:hypothetical protein n=1 Tax=Planktomarina sp. TaxID=2024851 RepID=UPI003C771D3E
MGFELIQLHRFLVRSHTPLTEQTQVALPDGTAVSGFTAEAINNDRQIGTDIKAAGSSSLPTRGAKTPWFCMFPSSLIREA